MAASPPTPIAVDGLAASGKGTLARALANRLGYAYLDTGRLYRRLAHAILQAGIRPQEEARAHQHASQVQLDAPLSAAEEQALRHPDISEAAAYLSAQAPIRALLLDAQRHFAQHPPPPAKGAVLDGRDIGTVVCPQAPLKFYVHARLAVRAGRRWAELAAREPQLTRAAVQASLARRDAQDKARLVSPLKAARDAHYIDTSDTTPAEALAAALAFLPPSAAGAARD